jgi:hypothetical protein
MYHTQALMALGKLKNPVTDTIEKNREQAQLLIDILTVIKEKTKGNLSVDEIRLLDDSLRNLQLNFIAD